MNAPKEVEGVLRLIQAIAQSTSSVLETIDAHGHSITHAMGEISKIETEMCSSQVTILGFTGPAYHTTPTQRREIIKNLIWETDQKVFNR
eukprot:11178252-Karenia_brevis.AAC.1